jgi:hypothetical protein
MDGDNGQPRKRRKLPRPNGANGEPTFPVRDLDTPSSVREPVEVPATRLGHQAKRLTPELVSAIENLLAVQPNKSKVCREIGIHLSTFKRWFEEGEDEDAPDEYRMFRAAVERAALRWERSRLEAITSAAEGRTKTKRRIVDGPNGKTTTIETEDVGGDWRAAAWLLERRMPKDYGRTEKIEHSGQLGLATALTFLRSDLDDEDRARLPAPE